MDEEHTLLFFSWSPKKMDMVRVSSLTVINHLECKGPDEGQGHSANIQNHLFSIQKVAPEELVNVFYELLLYL